MRIKLYAIFLGPVGFGIISQLYNFFLLFTSVTNLGVPVSTTSEISKLHSEGTEESESKIAYYFRYITLRILLLSVVLSVLVILFSGYISDFLVDDGAFYYFLIIIFISAPFTILYSIMEAFLRSFKRINTIVNISVITNIASILILIPLVYFWNMTGVGIYLLVFGILPMLLFIIFCKDIIKKYIKRTSFLPSSEEKSLIFKVGLISLSSSLIHQGIIILIRKILISEYGYEQNGLYQSVLSVSITYFSIIYIFLTNYSLPKLAECSDNDAINSELSNNLRFLLLIITPMMLIFLGYRDILVSLLFSKNFSGTTSLFVPQFIGDLFRVGAALFGLWLIPRRKIKQIIIIDVIFNTIFISSVYIFVAILNMPLIYVSYAYAMSFGMHFLMYFVYSRNSIGYSANRIITLTFLYTILSLTAVSYLSNINRELSYYATPFIIVIWFLLSVNKEEMYKSKKMIYDYINKYK